MKNKMLTITRYQENSNKTTMKDYITIRMAFIEKTDDNKYQYTDKKYVETREP